ncbi:MAG: hypothetical protein Q9M50_09570 [Methylococcales bacterium]|nr:hypothetical protein [Methylococcales bacterium]
MMIHAAINILLLGILLLLVGLWRPKIILFWLDSPGRWPIIIVFIIFAMVGATLFGEGTRQKQLELEALQSKKISPDKIPLDASADIPSVMETTASKQAINNEKQAPTTELNTVNNP